MSLLVNLLGQGFVRDNLIADWIVLANTGDWFVETEEKTDYYTWQPSFTATHESLGSISGDYKGNITLNPTSTEEALIECFNQEVECYLGDFNPKDI